MPSHRDSTPPHTHEFAASDLASDTILRGAHVDSSVQRERVRQRRLLRLAIVLLVPLVVRVVPPAEWRSDRLGDARSDRRRPDDGDLDRSAARAHAADPHPVPRRRSLAALAAATVRLRRAPHRRRRRRRDPSRGDRHAQPVPRPRDVLRRRWAARLAAACCSKALRAPARPTWPRRSPPRPACRSCSCRRARSSRCTTARPTARSARTSRRCARRLAPRAGRSASSRSSTRSAARAAGMNSGSMREGIVGIVNELLVQMQSFDLPTPRERVLAKVVDAVNVFLPAHRALPRPRSSAANILVVAATNRAADLDPALLRPGRFDRVIHFDLPPRADRVEIAALLPRAARRTTASPSTRRRRPHRRLQPGEDRAPARRGAHRRPAPRPRER